MELRAADCTVFNCKSSKSSFYCCFGQKSQKHVTLVTADTGPAHAHHDDSDMIKDITAVLKLIMHTASLLAISIGHVVRGRTLCTCIVHHASCPIKSASLFPEIPTLALCSSRIE